MDTDQLILIVDDELINLDLLETALVGRRYRVARAEDGRQALALARDFRPAIIVTDILMPNMDGYQLCREIVADPELRDIPVIFYSATYTDREDRDFALSLGAARFIVKPSNPESIVQAIEEILAEQPNGERIAQDLSPPDEPTFLLQYNRRLIAKLEKKIADLDCSNQLMDEQVRRAQQAEQKIRQLALVDRLTGLPTRIAFVDSVDAFLASGSSAGSGHGLLQVVVDSFREINYAIGQGRGSLLLKGIAARIAEIAAALSSRVARVGGADFAVFITGMRDIHRLESIASDIVTAFERPFDIDGLTVDVTVSVGIAVSPDHAETAEVLLRHAGVALRDARGVRGFVAAYNRDNDPFEPGQVRLISGIRQAIRDDRLVVHYQPKIHLSRRTTVGLEALIRWNHPELGMLAPGAFIGIAEQTGLVKPLGRWLFKKVLQEQERLRDEGNELEVSINLSTRNLLDGTLPDQFMEEVAAQGLHDPPVTLEITENSILKDPGQAQTILERLSGMGLEIAIDDFGTGYSSLTHLKLLPVRELKIDRSFIIDMMGHENNVLIVRSIIDLAHALGLRVTAEGVESAESLERLAQFGCDRAQGFHMARPMPVDELRRWLHDSPWNHHS